MRKSKFILYILFFCISLFCFQDCFAESVGKVQGAQTTYNLTNYEEGTGILRGCTPWGKKYAELQACILCPVFNIILKTDQSMASMSFGSLASGFRNVIIVVLALFIAYQTLLTVSAVTKQDVAKYLQTISIQAFKVLVAALLLTNSTYVYEYVINPLMQAALEFGLTIIGTGVSEQLAENTNVSEMPEGVISQNLLAQVLATVRLFSKSNAELPAIGSSLMCVACHTASWHSFPDISMLIEGAIVWAFGWAITLACCFYLLDSVVRFGIFCTLLPFLIACWPFKITSKYTKNGWDIFMNTFFNFVMMGLVISLSSELATQALTGGAGGKEEIEALLQSANSNDLVALKDAMSLSGTKLLVLIACCIFAFKLVAQISELANAVSSTSGPAGKDTIGSKLGNLAAQTATRAAFGSKDKDGKRKGGIVGAAGKITGISGLVDGIKDRAAARHDAIRSRIAGFGGGGGTPGGGAGGGTPGGGAGGGTPGGGAGGGAGGGGAPDGGGAGGGGAPDGGAPGGRADGGGAPDDGGGLFDGASDMFDGDADDDGDEE